jgi:hypothetical protein
VVRRRLVGGQVFRSVSVFLFFSTFCLVFVLSSLPVVDGEGPRNFVV